MAVRFILGRAGAGKTEYCLQEAAGYFRRHPDARLIIMVPEQATYQMEKAFAEKIDNTGFMGAEVLSFRRLAYRVFNEVGGAARSFIGDLGKRMILRRILAERRQDLHIFGAAANRPGFADHLSEALSECKMYKVTPEAMAFAGERYRGENAVLAAKLHDLSLIYADFTAFLQDRYLDPDDFLTLLADKIKKSRYLSGAYIWLDGFVKFTPQQLDVLAELGKRAGRVTVSLCLDQESFKEPPAEGNVFFLPAQTLDRVVRKLTEAGVPVEAPVFLDGDQPPRRFAAADLVHLEQNFFRQPVRTFAGMPMGIRLLAAANRRAETEGAAREITRLVREKGYRYRDIGLLLRNLADYAPLIETIFADHDIPFFLDEKRTVMHHPLIELIRSALETVAGNWPTDAVFRFLKTDLTPVSRDEVDLLENFCLAYGIRGHMWLAEKPWGAGKQLAAGEKEHIEKINGIRQRAVQHLLNFHRAVQTGANVADYAQALYRLLTDLNVPDRLQAMSSAAIKRGSLDRAREHDQVFGGVIAILDEAVDALGTETLSIGEFAEILETGFETLRLGLIPPGLDQVTVGSLDRSRNPKLKAAFVLGVNDGVLPAKIGEEGLFTDAERLALTQIGVALSPGSRQRIFEEQFYVYTALTRASEYLWVSYPLADEEGRGLAPSYVIRRLREIFPRISERMLPVIPDPAADDLEFITNPGRTLSYLAANLRERKKGFPLSPVWLDAYNVLAADREWAPYTRRILSALFAENQERPISPQTAKKLYGQRLCTSVTRLEKFAACPFAHFAAFGLRLKERPVYKLTAPDLGQFFHGVLKKIGDWLLAEHRGWGDLTPEECSALSSQAVSELAPALQNEILMSTARYRYITRKLTRIVERTVSVLAAQERRGQGQFMPLYLEAGFGHGETLPPLILTLPGGESLELNGRIDRIDGARLKDALYLRVIDYKSGTPVFDLSRLYFGLSLQLLVYLDVILENTSVLFGEPGFFAGMLYFMVKNPLLSVTRPLTGEDLENALLKKFRMQGLLVDNAEVVRLMDQVTAKADSPVIPVYFDAAGLGKRSKVVSDEVFNRLRQHIRQLLTQAGEAIFRGEVGIRPAKWKDFLACGPCEFRPVCQFDTLRPENDYHRLPALKADEVVALLMGQGGDS